MAQGIPGLASDHGFPPWRQADDDSRAGEPSRFVGRDHELARLRGCAERVRSGLTEVVVVEGEAGIGKTSLINRLLQDLDDFLVLRATGDRSETDLPFGVVDQLTRCVPGDQLEEFTLLGRDALTPYPGNHMSPFSVGAQFTRLLDQLQSGSPIAIVVDDVNWADDSSQRALAFVIRRLWADRVLLVLTLRPEEMTLSPAAVDWRRLVLGVSNGDRLVLSTLSLEEVTAWAEREFAGRSLPPGTAEALHHVTRGHPLHLQTVLAEMAGPRLAPAPVPRPLSAALRRQAGLLPVNSRALLEALAVLDTWVPLRLAGHVAGLDDAEAAVQPLVDTGFVWHRAEGPTSSVSIRNELQRDAVVSTTSPWRLRELHATVAPLVNSAASWRHKVAAAGVTSPGLAAELEGAAAKALETGDVERAATYLLWAADLLGERGQRERLLLTAAAHLIWIDKFSRVEQLMDEVRSCEPSTLRDLVIAAFAISQGESTVSEMRLARAMDSAESAPGMAWAAAMAGVWLGTYLIIKGQGEEAARFSRRVLRMDFPGMHFARRAKINLVYSSGFHGPQAALRRLDEVYGPAGSAAEDFTADHLMWRGIHRSLAGELRSGAEDIQEGLDYGKVLGQPMLDEFGQIHLGLIRYLSGAWDDAVISTRKSILVQSTEGRPWLYAHSYGLLAAVHAGRGDFVSAQKCAMTAEDSLLGVSCLTWVIMAKAAIHQAAGDYRSMLDAMRPLIDTPETTGQRMLELWWLPVYAEALIECDRRTEAEEVLARLGSLAADIPYLRLAEPWLCGRFADRSSDHETALSMYEHAVRSPVDLDENPIHRAFAEQAYGTALLAGGYAEDGHAWLATARDRFTSVTAFAFARRCEKRLAGARSSAPAAADKLAGMTERERHIAHLVGNGLTNKEVAAELFISTHTVNYHLRNIYAKLGISSRRSLRDHVRGI
ncbi:helix-turn-helix transcriptional regulator [Acrocarpospora catenulata]|uniref:helix-turn-helix transcriptional regulator n=1 Tax=Acrocarpospora catenulata TaxID=2836182 RepID=UPI001BDA80DC|nr:AAA family ATPase [Acrocarpospora catenulata]